MEKIWLKNYSEGVSAEIDLTKYANLVDLMEKSFQKFKDLPAFNNMDKTLTYSQLDKLSRDFAAYLQSIGLQKGDKLGIQMPNLLQYPVAMIGALRAGLVVVNVNPLYTVREMTHQYKDSECKAVVILANFASNLEKCLPHLPQLQHIIITEVGDLLGGLKKPIVNFVVKNIKKMVLAYHIPQATKFGKTLQIGKRKPFKKQEITQEDLAFLQYTGGTTGVSKGAMLSHKNILANLLQVKECFNAAKGSRSIEEGREVVITPLPLYHVYALTINCFVMILIGAKIILITNARDMKDCIKTIRKNPFTIMTGVNTLYNAFLNQAEFLKLDFSKAKIFSAGGMALQKSVLERWEKLTGVRICEGYGLSETSPVLTTNPFSGNVKVGAIGMPVPSTELCIMSDAGEELSIGEVGEICAKGPQVMPGYWNRPDETAKVFVQDDWFKTGDMGYMDNDGYFYIVDRKKDMILVSGFNVYPNEIEDVVAMHAGVLEVAAIGVPDEKATERVKIFVVKKDANLTKEDLMAHCKENLTGYKMPKEIEFRTELPKSNVGKILRRQLKEETVEG
jgi:long-chain acyl-CoA synthetase